MLDDLIDKARNIVPSLLAHFYQPDGSSTIEALPLISFDRLFEFLQEEENLFVHALLSIDPYSFGFNGRYFGIHPVPEDIVAIPGLICTRGEEVIPIATQYMLANPFASFTQMREELERDLHSRVLVWSGYRSSAYQVLVILKELQRNEYDFAKTLKAVAFPGYSEHGSTTTPAIDIFIDQRDPQNPNEKFVLEKSEEFIWLNQNAKRFNYSLSYPEDNSSGIIFEPWHWRYSAS